MEKGGEEVCSHPYGDADSLSRWEEGWEVCVPPAPYECTLCTFFLKEKTYIKNTRERSRKKSLRFVYKNEGVLETYRRRSDILSSRNVIANQSHIPKSRRKGIRTPGHTEETQTYPPNIENLVSSGDAVLPSQPKD